MQARRLPAIRGWRWIVEGFRLFRANPAPLTFLVFGYWLVLLTLDMAPLIGMALAPLCVPVLSVGVMNGCRALERGSPSGLGLLFSGFRQNRATLLILGAINLVCSLLIIASSAPFDDGAFLNAIMTGQAPPEDMTDQLMASMQIPLLLMVPVTLAFWFAPMLAAWDDFPAGKALFFSFAACLRNWRAFLVYGFGVACFAIILPGFVLELAQAVSLPVLNTTKAVLLLPLLFIFAPTLFASFYISYRDIFIHAGTADA